MKKPTLRLAFFSLRNLSNNLSNGLLFWEFNGGLNLAVFMLRFLLFCQMEGSDSCEFWFFRGTISQKLFHFSSLLGLLLVRARENDHKVL
jgi:hypothetical protein